MLLADNPVEILLLHVAGFLKLRYQLKLLPFCLFEASLSVRALYVSGIGTIIGSQGIQFAGAIWLFSSDTCNAFTILNISGIFLPIFIG